MASVAMTSGTYFPVTRQTAMPLPNRSAGYRELKGIGTDGLSLASRIQPLRPDGTPRTTESLTKEQETALQAARDFEGIFVHFMMKAMRNSVPKSGLLGTSFQSETYQQMFDEQLSRVVTQDGKGIGLAEMVYQEFMRQEKSREAAASAMLSQ